MKATIFKLALGVLLVGLLTFIAPVRSTFFGVSAALILMGMLLFWDDLPPRSS